jgi:hypothetical protein
MSKVKLRQSRDAQAPGRLCLRHAERQRLAWRGVGIGVERLTIRHVLDAEGPTVKRCSALWAE